MLWVRTLDGVVERTLPGTEGASAPFWAPDGRTIGFFAAGKVWRVTAAGGPPLALCEAPNPRGGTWGEDGTILFGLLNQGLFRVPVHGGASAKMTTPDRKLTERTHNWPCFVSPGRFTYLVRSDDPANTAVYAATLDKPADRIRLVTGSTNAVYSVGHLLWLRTSTLMAQPFDPVALRLSGEPIAVIDPVATFAPQGQMVLAASQNGTLLFDAAATNTREFTWFDRVGKRLGTVGVPTTTAYFSLTPDGKRVVYEENAQQNYIWWMDTERGTRASVISGPEVRYAPIWLPGEAKIAFVSGTQHNIFVHEVNGHGQAQRLTESPNRQTPLDWSLDGRWLLYRESNRSDRMNLWTLAVGPEGQREPGAKARPLATSEFRSANGRFFPEPNPKWVVYDGNETGQYEVYVQSFPEPTTRVQVSNGGGRSPRWGAGGKEVLWDGANRRMMSAKLKFSGASVVLSEPKELFVLPETGALQSFEVTADGERFLVLMPKEEVSRPLAMILNWTALLDRREKP